MGSTKFISLFFRSISLFLTISTAAMASGKVKLSARFLSNPTLTPENTAEIIIPATPTLFSMTCVEKCRQIVGEQDFQDDFCLNNLEMRSDAEIVQYRDALIRAVLEGHIRAMYNFAITVYDNTDGLDPELFRHNAKGLPNFKQLKMLPKTSTCRFFIEDPQVTHTLLEKIANSKTQVEYLDLPSYQTALWLVSRDYQEGRKCPRDDDMAFNYAVEAYNYGCVCAREWLFAKSKPANALTTPKGSSFKTEAVQEPLLSCFTRKKEGMRHVTFAPPLELTEAKVQEETPKGNIPPSPKIVFTPHLAEAWHPQHD